MTQESRALVNEGWQHLELQRPLAAWASWQRALRLDPDDPAAKKALETLEHAYELPAVARAVYRFQTPTEETRRTRWNAVLRAESLVELDLAAEAFASLTNENPSDAEAWLNLALCRAWLGRNTDSIACLDRVVSLLAASHPDRAADAWTLAEVLRLGAGAETLADDFRYVWVVDRREGPGISEELLDDWPNLVALPMPIDPVTGAPQIESGKLFEWLDRPKVSQGRDSPDRAEEPPRVLASVILTPNLLRISSPDPAGFVLLEEPAFSRVSQSLASARRERTPLPIAWADAALGTFRLPPRLDDSARAGLARSVVESYYETLWIHPPRRSLDGASPLAASRAASEGDVVARARLMGLIRFREQLGVRPTHAAIYQGYPFDRLRRRLGLMSPSENSGAFDQTDLSCMSECELDELDPTTLDPQYLVDAFLSASAFRDDARTARFAAPLARLTPFAQLSIEPVIVFGPLVRESLRVGEPDAALAWLESARSLVNDSDRQTFAIWSAEIHARTGSPEAALRTYQGLLENSQFAAAVAFDGAETLLDNGYPDHALPLLLEARTRAQRAGDRVISQAADRLLSQRSD